MSVTSAKIMPITSMTKSERIDRSDIRNGVVVTIESDHIIVDISGKKETAKKAFSCFIEPQPNDRVICSRDENRVFYILGIIERKDQQKVTISYPSDANIISQKGDINLRSQKAVSLMSEKLNFFSKTTLHKSQEAVVSFDEITATGTTLHAGYKTVRLISNLINTMARQVIDTFQGYIRNTDGNDQIRAGQLTRRADTLYSMDSKYTVMVSKKDTKIDGERIHMG
ncbi:MAG: DUF3540 domain-containing protein [Desulfobacula sp.]|nr:DUF3540 domain-containing protein [Desulfobacula sp.]